MSVTNNTSEQSISHDINQNTHPCHYQSLIVDSAHVSDILNLKPPTPQRFRYKLPTLDLPTFSDDILLWQTFWESFESTVHTKLALSSIQKFTQTHNEAQICIWGLSLTRSNYMYEQAVVLLKERFGQQRKNIDAHMQKLITLPSHTIIVNSLSAFTTTLKLVLRV